MSKICPKCGYAYFGEPALSREDGKTDICPDCGMREALNAWKKMELSMTQKKLEGADEQGED